MTCAICHGPYHPATGHAFTESCVLCGPCARDFYQWYKTRMIQMGKPQRKRGGLDKGLVVIFAEAAGKSIIGD